MSARDLRAETEREDGRIDWTEPAEVIETKNSRIRSVAGRIYENCAMVRIGCERTLKIFRASRSFRKTRRNLR